VKFLTAEVQGTRSAAEFAPHCLNASSGSLRLVLASRWLPQCPWASPAINAPRTAKTCGRACYSGAVDNADSKYTASSAKLCVLCASAATPGLYAVHRLLQTFFRLWSSLAKHLVDLLRDADEAGAFGQLFQLARAHVGAGRTYAAKNFLQAVFDRAAIGHQHFLAF
jgi:hypothetical protein